MLDNNYSDLYNIDLYKMRTYFLSGKESIEFKTLYAYVNLIYVESKKCIDVINDEINVVRESKIIYTLLEENPYIFDILKEARDVEKITYVGGKRTYLDAAVMVCEEHLKKMNTVVHK